VPELIRRIGGISSDALIARTGKSWEEWLLALDRAGARRLTRKAIATMVGRRFRLGPWWQQVIAIGYQQARGLGTVPRTTGGYQVSARKTISAPATELFRYWSDARRRKTWLPHQALTITARSPGRTISAAWGTGRERLDVTLAKKPGGKTQVIVTHRRLPTRAAAARARLFWRTRLGVLSRTVRSFSNP
jgi:uncharacterized protein YndB with AHSA1/START domain